MLLSDEELKWINALLKMIVKNETDIIVGIVIGDKPSKVEQQFSMSFSEESLSKALLKRLLPGYLMAIYGSNARFWVNIESFKYFGVTLIKYKLGDYLNKAVESMIFDFESNTNTVYEFLFMRDRLSSYDRYREIFLKGQQQRFPALEIIIE